LSVHLVDLCVDFETFRGISRPKTNKKGLKLQEMPNSYDEARHSMASATENPNRTPVRAYLFWISLAQLISWGSTLYLFGLSVDPIEKLLHISRGQTSLAFGLAMLVEGLLAYPVGRLIDSGHGRAVMTGGSVASCLGLLGLSQVESLAQFYLAWACIGAAMSCILYTPIFSITTRRFPSDYRRSIIVITFLGGLASTVFIPLMSWLMMLWGWSMMVVAMAGFHLLVCAPIHWLLLRYEPAGRTPTSPGALATSVQHRTIVAQQRKVMLLIGLFTALGMALASALAAHLIPMLRERGMSAFWIVWIPAAVGAIQVLGRVGILWSDGRFNVHRVNAVIVWLSPLGMLLLIIAGTDTALLLIFACVWGIANGCQTIVKGTAVAQYVSQENVAALNGSLGLPTALFRTFVPWGIGLLWSPTGGYASATWALFGIGITAALAFVLAQRASMQTLPDTPATLPK
jgi:predicted MFS family arabinose efflux permease